MKFHFSVSDGISTLFDREGCDLPSVIAAREFVDAKRQQILRRLERFIVITNENNEFVAKIDLDKNDLIGSGNIENTKFDITDLAESLEHSDGLTGLPNRSTFRSMLADTLEIAREKKSKVILALIHLDHLRSINSTLGEKSGDVLLKEAAARLTFLIGPTGFVARVASSEFAVILSDAPVLDEKINVLQKIQKLLKQPVAGMDGKANCSGSIGIAVFPDNEPNAAQILKSVDVALYFAKRSARGGIVFFSPYMHRLVRRRLVLDYDDRVDLGIQKLTAREQIILSLIVQGVTTRKIAEQLGISVRTVDFHRANILQKYNAKNVADLTRIVFTHDIES
jgi:diguanylate cyclase (GGDEF)-like protein